MYRSIRFAVAKSDTFAIALRDDQKSLSAGYEALDKQLGGAISDAIARPELSTKLGAVTTLYPSKGAARLFIVGLGKASRPIDAARLAGTKLVNAAFNAKVKSLSLLLLPALDKASDIEAIGSALGEGMTLGNFEFTTYKSTRVKAKSKSAALDLTATLDKPLANSAAHGALVSESANLARTLAATPPNVANPKYLCDFAKKMAKEVGLSCKIIDNTQAKKLGMGGLTAVGAGGSEKPALICLEWKGQGPRAKGLEKKSSLGPVLLVGKAITFDTGGYSLKSMPGMLGMKYDKCGGMAVLGAMHAIAKLKLPIHVVGLVPTAENMIDEDAYRPNDIITFCNGVTCEITNTDAEGRLVLADALAYGCKTYKPRAVIDLATLTGAVVVALGVHCAGAFVNDDALHKRLFDAAERTGERLWHLPLWDEHKDYMKGHHSDLVNSGIREAGAIQGAAFLSSFVAKDGDFEKNDLVPWAHLDIAGTAEYEREVGPFPKGPTGFGVRLLVRALEQWK